MGLLDYRQFIAVRAGGPDDPEASRAGAVLGAYFDVEQARASRRIVWRATALVGVVAWGIDTATPLLTRVDVAFGSALLGGGVVAMALVEWRARQRLKNALKTLA